MHANEGTQQRFIVLSTARTGSNLLLSLLNSHECIKMYGELFNLEILTPENLKEALTDPVTYLRKRLYAREEGEKKIIGYKMFYDHFTFDYFKKEISAAETAQDLKKRITNLNDHIQANYSKEHLHSSFQKVWNGLADDSDLKIIHLKRTNKLETLVSLKTAYLTNKWMHWKPEGFTRTVIHLDYEECFNYFSKIDAYELKYDAIFRHHSKIDISYEELVKDKQQLANKVFDFLDVAHKPVSTILKKQIMDRPEEIIDNYDDLKKAFAGTPWHTYFENRQIC